MVDVGAMAGQHVDGEELLPSAAASAYRREAALSFAAATTLAMKPMTEQVTAMAIRRRPKRRRRMGSECQGRPRCSCRGRVACAIRRDSTSAFDMLRQGVSRPCATKYLQEIDI